MQSTHFHLNICSITHRQESFRFFFLLFFPFVQFCFLTSLRAKFAYNQLDCHKSTFSHSLAQYILCEARRLCAFKKIFSFKVFWNFLKFMTNFPNLNFHVSIFGSIFSVLTLVGLIQKVVNDWHKTEVITHTFFEWERDRLQKFFSRENYFSLKNFYVWNFLHSHWTSCTQCSYKNWKGKNMKNVLEVHYAIFKQESLPLSRYHAQWFLHSTIT